MDLIGFEISLDELIEGTIQMNEEVGDKVKCTIHDDGRNVHIRIEYKED